MSRTIESGAALTASTCMVGFAAHYIIQSIKQSPSTRLSDWSVFRLATLLELVAELEKQANGRHQLVDSDTMSVVDAMAKQVSSGIHMVLAKKTSASTPLVNGSNLDTASMMSTELRTSKEDDEIWKVMTTTAAQHSGLAYKTPAEGFALPTSSFNPFPNQARQMQQMQAQPYASVQATTSSQVMQSPFSDHDPFGLNSNTIPFFAECQLEDFLSTTMPDGTAMHPSTNTAPWKAQVQGAAEMTFENWLGSNGLGDATDLGIFGFQ